METEGERGRENLELEKQRPIHIIALGSRRTDKSGAGCLDTGCGPGGGFFFLCFVENNDLELGIPNSPILRNLLIKTSPPPITVLCLGTIAGGQSPLCSVAIPFLLYFNYPFSLSFQENYKLFSEHCFAIQLKAKICIFKFIKRFNRSEINFTVSMYSASSGRSCFK